MSTHINTHKYIMIFCFPKYNIVDILLLNTNMTKLLQIILIKGTYDIWF